MYAPPDPAAPESYRIDLCAAVEREPDSDRSGILFRVIPAGRCAVLRHTGTDETLGESIRSLMSRWFPGSGERRRDFPLFLQRVRFFPEVPEGESEVDIFLPLD